MSLPDDFLFDSESFRGIVRLFPLPGLVLFPHVMQPFHIFEPRYRQMLEEALADDRLIAMAALAPDWESDYEGRPALEKHACLCRVATHHRRDDGTYNILLVGLRRVELVRELAPDKLFREAEIKLLEDRYPLSGLAQRAELQRNLMSAFKGMLPTAGGAHKQFEQLFASDIPLGMLCDILGFTMKLDIGIKLQLLAQTDVDVRARLLLATLATMQARESSSKGDFPPGFSVN